MKKDAKQRRIDQLEAIVNEAVHECANATADPQNVARLRNLAQLWNLALVQNQGANQ